MSDSPFAPLEFSVEPREESAQGAGEEHGGAVGVPVRSRDRHGRGLRHPLPLGRRARRSRQDRLEEAVQKAVENLGGLGEPGLLGVVVRVQRIPDHADALLSRLRAGMRPGPEQLWSSVSRRDDGTLVVTLHERPILAAVEPEELDTAVYATVLARCAEALGRDPQQLDPGWGSL